MAQYYTQLLPSDVRGLLYEYIPAYEVDDYSTIPGLMFRANIPPDYLDDPIIYYLKDAIIKNDINYVISVFNRPTATDKYCPKFPDIDQYIHASMIQCIQSGRSLIIKYLFDNYQSYTRECLGVLHVEDGSYLSKCNDVDVAKILIAHGSTFYYRDICILLSDRLASGNLPFVNWLYTAEIIRYGLFPITILSMKDTVCKSIEYFPNRAAMQIDFLNTLAALRFYNLVKWLLTQYCDEVIRHHLEYYKENGVLAASMSQDIMADNYG